MAKRHVVPGEVVRKTLRERGVDSVNLATQFAAVNGITPSRVVAIVRGKRATVPFDHAEEIALALGVAPEIWETDWAEWALPVDVEALLRGGQVTVDELFSSPGRGLCQGDRVVHETGRLGTLRRFRGLACEVAFDDGRELVIPQRRLRPL